MLVFVDYICLIYLHCSYRVRGVEGGCAKHLTIEFYMIFGLLTFVLIIISISSPPHSFILSTVAFLFFFRTDSTDSTDCLLIVLSIYIFTF